MEQLSIHGASCSACGQIYVITHTTMAMVSPGYIVIIDLACFFKVAIIMVITDHFLKSLYLILGSQLPVDTLTYMFCRFRIS